MEDSGSDAIQKLYPALTECFVIIISGYLAGRLNLISETEAKGIHTFVGTFSLPSLIFMSLAQLDLSLINKPFLLSIFLAKAILFFAVIIVTLLVRRPVNLGRAGLFAIFCTQSNDFAIGYPIVDALYKNTHPHYATYLYLLAPISLAILNPFAFVLMEVGKRRNLQQENDYAFKLIIGVIKNIFLNPIVFMTLLGIGGNFVFKHQVPCLLGQILEVMGSAFPATALFLLGLRMVGKVHKLKGATLIVPGVLIMVKLLFMPIIIREFISAFESKSGSNATESEDLSTYGFLYGTFPSAPAAFVFASQYALDVDLIASAMVACTFISAPLMFVSAKMITLTKTDPSTYMEQLKDFTFDVSIAGVVAGVWVIFLFYFSKKLSRIPQTITACLVVSQLFSCTGAILWHALGEKSENWTSYLQFVIFTTGVYGARLWTAFLAVTLVLLQSRSLCFVAKLKRYFYVLGWGVPLVLSILFLIFDRQHSVPYDERNPNFIYGAPQAVVSISLLILCFIVTVGSLILHQRYNVRHTNYVRLAGEIASTFDAPAPVGTTSETMSDIEDLSNSLRGPNGNCRIGCNINNGGGRGNSCNVPSTPSSPNIEHIEEESDTHDSQILSHLVLLIFLLCSMFVGAAVSAWTIITETTSGIYVEMCFLDATLNFGQAIIVCVIFGLNTKQMLLPLLDRWNKKLTLPDPDDLDVETKQICEQFRTHHYDNCKRDLAKDKRWRLKVYESCFTGRELIDWLIEYGLARDRVEAVHYGRRLVQGKILRHINCVYHFYDRNLLYTFD